MAVFFSLPLYQDFDARKRTKIFSMEYPCASKRMKELNLLSVDETELQLLECLILFAVFRIRSMWGSENDTFQQNKFRKIFVFFDPGEPKRAKKTAEKTKRTFNCLHS